MMTASVVSAGAAKSGYYQTEGYYKAGSPEAEAATQWFGKAAEKFGLVGQIDDARFAAILDGETPSTGRMMGKYVDGERQHRPGLDLTFSAPKSVSIAALVFGDERVVEAHNNAVKTAMEHVEKNLVQTRLFEHGELKTETGGDIIAGMFRHDTSRALDPQLHTHVVIANMVLNSQGRFTALHNDKIFRDVKLGSEIYRSELAASLRELGYTPQRSGPHGLLELKEVPDSLIQTFSKRRQQIVDALDQRGLPDNARTAQLAALATRATKEKEIDRAALKESWKQTALEHAERNPEISSLAQKIKDGLSAIIPTGVLRNESRDRAEDASHGVKTAIQHLSENAAVFSESDLLSASLRFAKTATLTDIKETVSVALKERDLRLTDSPKGDGSTYLTSKEQVAVERKIFSELKKGDDQNAHRFTPQPKAQLMRRLDRSTLSEGQRQAVALPFMSNDRFVAVQGYAGTGKTYMLSRMSTEAQKTGFKIEAVGPTHQSVKELNSVINNAETLKARLMRGGPSQVQVEGAKNPDHSKTILVVDEASMISSKDMLQLFQQSNRLGVHKVVLIGDIQQLEAVKAGSAFAALQKRGIEVVIMDDIQRQKNETSLNIVKHAIAGEVHAAFEKIGKNIIQTKDIPQKAAERYISTSGTTGIATNTNRMRVEVNEAVREELRAQGTLIGRDLQIKGLDPRHFTVAELGDARSYQKGDILFARADVKGTRLTENTILRVHEINADKNRLDLVSDDGRTTRLILEPGNKYLEKLNVYTETTRDFASGDRVKFRIIEDGSPVTHGETGQVALASEKGLMVKLDSGKTVEIDPQSLTAKGMDHGYALTLHDMQGATLENPIAAMRNGEALATQKSFYVAVSRASNEATLITDDAGRLARQIENQTGERPNALDLLRPEPLPQEPVLSKQDERKALTEIKLDPTLFPDLDRDRRQKDAGEMPADADRDEGKDQNKDQDARTEPGDISPMSAEKFTQILNEMKKTQQLNIERIEEKER